MQALILRLDQQIFQKKISLLNVHISSLVILQRIWVVLAKPFW